MKAFWKRFRIGSGLVFIALLTFILMGSIDSAPMDDSDLAVIYDNITLKNDRPQWHNKCQQCYACLQWCPKSAIQYGNKTAGIERYHHPDINVKEIIDGGKTTDLTIEGESRE